MASDPAGGSRQLEERVYNTKLSTIHYEHEDQLEELYRKIRPGAFNRTLNKIFLGTGADLSGGNIAELVDTLFRRVQLILDMRQPKLKIHIRLHKDRKALYQAYLKAIGSSGSVIGTRTGRARSKVPIAFYWKKTNTIHVQPEKLSMEVLAHEMGHATIDHYFVIRPPPKIAEMLCHYVDKELSAGNSF